MIILIATLALPATLLPLLATFSWFPRRISSLVAVGALLLALVELPFILIEGPHGIWYYPTNLVSFDGIAFAFSVTVITVSTMAAVGSAGFMKDESNSAIYYSLILFTTIGMILVSSSTDLIFLLVSWELMTVPTFVLVAMKRGDRRSSEAAMKYFLAAALSAALILFGLSFAYGLAGSTSFSAVASAFANNARSAPAIYLLTAALLLSGFAVKMAIVPFHFWLPDTLQGGFPQVSAILAAGSKKAGFAAAIRITLALLLVSRFSSFSVSWQLALALAAAATITWGNVAALTQSSISRMLAYSSIAQAGYIMIGLAVQGTAGAALGLIGIFLQVLFHGVMKGSAFISLENVGDSMEDLSGLYRKAPFTSVALAVSLFSLAGLPPLNGFWGKLYLFLGAVQGSLWWLAAVALANSAIALAYYSYLAKRMFFDEPVTASRKERLEVVAVLAFSTAFIVITGFYPSPFITVFSRLGGLP
jgi:proton-translocating NADH-quinone oxidoreductase chain N